MADRGEPLPLPDNPMPELSAMLLEFGPAQDMGSMGGAAPISAAELQDWATGSATLLTPWEFSTLLEMSHAYVQQMRISADPATPAPWALIPDADRRTSIAASVKSLLRD